MFQAAMAPGAATAPFLFDQGAPEPCLAPAALRVEVAKLVAQNRMNEAEHWLAEGLRRFPDSEDLLIMRALLSEVALDWAGADKALQQLLSVQGAAAPIASWLHWVRVLRCMQDRPRAVTAVSMALRHHPDSEAIRNEAADLKVPLPALRRQAA
jgi:hypothetical protein